ncbi:MAG: hypothetical protein AAB519_02415 [Patescibacteria group bacterium]
MTAPIGVLRNTFVRLYQECFAATLVFHYQDFIILRNPTVPVFQGEYTTLESFYNENPNGFLMRHTACEKGETVLNMRDGTKKTFQTSNRYDINEARWIRMYAEALRNFSVADAKKLFEIAIICTVAHEMRHELQTRKELSPAQMFNGLPKLEGDLFLSDDLFVPHSQISKEDRLSLRKYARDLKDDTKTLRREIDAFAIGQLAMVAWSNARNLPYREKLKAVRNAVFSSAHPENPIKLPLPS